MQIQNEITTFRGEYQFLSNFYPCNINYDGLMFTSVEAAFQSAKCAEREDRLQFQHLDPVKAKKLGRRVRLRSDWEQVKLPILKDLVSQKFTNNPELAAGLLATGGALLAEGNTWHDNYYGDCTCDRCRDIPGGNHLGMILMELRGALLRNAAE